MTLALPTPAAPSFHWMTLAARTTTTATTTIMTNTTIRKTNLPRVIGPNPSLLEDPNSLTPCPSPFEKRTAKRESADRALFRSIAQHAAGTWGKAALEGKWDGVAEACLASLRGGASAGSASPAEQYAACRVLEASSVVLGGERDDVVEQLNESLKRVVNATGRATQVRAAALRCLSMVHFICGTDCLEEGEDSLAVMDLCEKVGGEKYRGEKVGPLLRATALDCWSLLATTLHNGHVAGSSNAGSYDCSGEDGEEDAANTGMGLGLQLGRGLALLPLLAECLDSSEVGLRCSAGECVALIHECRLNLGMGDQEADNATERRFHRGEFAVLL